MMPEPGFQKPMPYLADTDAQEVVDLVVGVERARSRSMSAPTLAWMRWSQCTVDGTATSGRPAVMNCSSAICAGGVLHGDAVGIEVGVAAAPLELLAARVAQVVDQDLLGAA